MRVKRKVYESECHRGAKIEKGRPGKQRAAPPSPRGPFLRRVIFGIGYTFGVFDVWTLLSQTLLQSDALTKQEFGSKKNLERTQGPFL